MNTIFLTKWRERLSKPTGISRDDVEKASSWLTCATGDRVFKEFGRRSTNYSDYLSKEASKVGVEFTDAVKSHDLKRAQEALEKIESFESIWQWDEKPEPSPICDSCGHDSTPAVEPKKKPKKRKPRA